MSINGEPLFEAFLNRHDDEAWREILWTLLPAIHEVDKNATRIWFYFYPLALARALDRAEDPEALARKLLLQGKYRLKDQIDSSHDFLYGHRFWPEVKAALAEHAASSPSSLDLAAQIKEVAGRVAKKLGVEVSLLLGITAVAFMTLQQIGSAAFKAASGGAVKPARKSPEQILRDRARDDSQGLFGFLRGEVKYFTVTFDESDPKAKFKLINSQHITTAAASDKRDHSSKDARCVPGEGPIPVECRSAACGTCWVGVLGGAEKLSEVAALEKRRMKEFGYIDTEDRHPVVRLACQAQAFGAVTIVVPPWNGVFGRILCREGEASEDEQKATHL
jgi:ferredoxin